MSVPGATLAPGNAMAARRQCYGRPEAMRLMVSVPSTKEWALTTSRFPLEFKAALYTRFESSVASIHQIDVSTQLRPSTVIELKNTYAIVTVSGKITKPTAATGCVCLSDKGP